MLRGLKRRDLLILIGLWLVVAALMCGAFTWFLVSRPAGPAGFGEAAPAASNPASIPGPAPTYTVEFVEVTARRFYPAAEALARAWEPDAQLVGVNASWSATAVNLVGNPTDWSFRFYSPARQRLYLAGVERNGQALGAPHFRKETSPPRTINPEAWVVDSPQALARWLDNGGAEWLGRNPGADVTIQLSVDTASGGPTWIINGVGGSEDRPPALKVDAATGQVSPWQP